MTQVTPVVLCGGSGTRLWPLSRSGFPKQFLVLSGGESSQSLFQQATLRINAIKDSSFEIGPPLIVTNEEHRFLVLDQLRELKAINPVILLEPSGRNTAPALTLAAFQAVDGTGYQQRSLNDPILVVVPADQTVQDSRAFTKALQDCVQLIDAEGAKQTIAILGIVPTSPETGYGYVRRTGVPGPYLEYTVEQFVEKPNAHIAKTYIDDGNYLWNSGVFVLRASTWIAALKEFNSEIFDRTGIAWNARITDQSDLSIFVRPDKKLFNDIPSESIDYAVIEKCPGTKFAVKMIELRAGWNDLGSWDAVWQAGMKDEAGNVSSGDVYLERTKNSLVHADGRLVGAVGVDNLIIVETADAVLVADRKYSQDVKGIVTKLELQNREEKNLHRKVVRPWGWYDSIDDGECFKVKRIQVKPGASLSMQLHHHRAEHWIVVSGIAEITNGDKVFTLMKNQSTYIPLGQIHRLANRGTEPLEIIEVQSGEYLGEDDIVRFEDTYGRI